MPEAIFRKLPKEFGERNFEGVLKDLLQIFLKKLTGYEFL